MTPVPEVRVKFLLLATVVEPFNETLPVPVESVVAPVWEMFPVNVAAPVTPRVPPKVVAPVPTAKVLDPVTEVAPFREIFPVPVLNVPDPVWENVELLFTVTFPERVDVPVTERLPE